MGLPALQIELEVGVEQRIERLEVNVEHIQSDVSEIKQDLRAFRQEVKQDFQLLHGQVRQDIQRLDSQVRQDIQRLDSKIDATRADLVGEIKSVKDSVTSLELKTQKSFADLKVGRALDKVWWLLIAGAILGVMARGFKWI